MVILYIAIALLSVFFLFAGSIKLTGWQKMIYETQVNMVAQYGINPAGLKLIGLMELFGAVTIWFQDHWIAPLGALTILAASLGAIVCHYIWDTWRESVPASITAPLSAYVAWVSREPLLAFLGVPGLI